MRVNGIYRPLNTLETLKSKKRIKHFSLLLVDPIFRSIKATYDVTFWNHLLDTELSEAKSVKIEGYIAVRLDENEWREKVASLMFIATKMIFDYHQ